MISESNRPRVEALARLFEQRAEIDRRIERLILGVAIEDNVDLVDEIFKDVAEDKSRRADEDWFGKLPRRWFVGPWGWDIRLPPRDDIGGGAV